MNIKKAIRNAFSKGLNRDIDKHQLQNQNIYWNENFRLITQEGQSNTLLENVKGNVNLKDINDVNMQGTYKKIIGHYVFDNKDIILFSVTTDLIDKYPSCSAIDLFKYDISNNKYASRITLYDEFHTNHLPGHLKLRDNITVIGRNETNFIRKIYWTDNDNTLRYANIAPDIDPNTGEPYDGFSTSDYATLNAQTLSDFMIIPQIDNSAIIECKGFGNGSLRSGTVAYTYRFFNKNGNMSNIGQSSELYPIFEASITTDTLSMEGSDVNTNSYKSFKGKLDITGINAQHDYVQIIGIYYERNDDTPNIKIIKNIELNSNNETTVYFEDLGDNHIDDMTLDEFRLIRNDYVAKTLERKDDRLFVGNIQEEYFDIDFDARAYRFADDGTGYIRATIYNSDGTIDRNVTTSNWGSVPTNSDCVNKYKNILTNDDYVRLHPEFNFKYQSNGSTIGGEGPNISYKFDVHEYSIDDYTYDGSTFNVHDLSTVFTTNNESWKYITGVYRSLQRDEIYRVGIVFFDNKGRQSFTKWIGDIRTPDLVEYELFNQDHIADWNQIKARALRLNVTVKNVPLNEDGTEMNYQIVYVERTGTDRTVIAAGYTIPMFYDGGSGIYEAGYNTRNIDYNLLSGLTSNTLYHEILSADLDYNIISLDNYHLYAYSNAEQYSTHDIKKTKHSGYDQFLIKTQKWMFNTTNPMYFVNSVGIEGYLEMKGMEYKVSNNTISKDENVEIKLSGKKYYLDGKKIHATMFDYGNSVTNYKSTLLYNNVLHLTDPIQLAEDIFYTYIRNFSYPYGGADYQSRTTSVYIPLSKVNTPTCHYGDTFINYYSRVQSGIAETYDPVNTESYTYGRILNTTYCLSDLDDPSINKKLKYQTTGYTSAVYLPMESNINLLLQHGFQMQKHSKEKEARLIQLSGNRKQITSDVYVKASWLGGVELTSVTEYLDYPDMYIYNPVYSKANTSKIYFSKPQIWDKLIHFPTRIKYSNIKSNGELIDSWLDFKPNNLQDVDTKYGAIEELKNWKNYMFCFQHRGMCMLPINERASTTGTAGSPIILGEGSILPKFLNYAQGSEKYGLQNNNHVITTENAIYWLDVIERKWLTFSSKSMELNFVKGLSSWLRNNIDENTTYSAGYDNQFKEVLFSWNEQTLVFSELLNTFQGVYTFNTDRFIHIPGLLSTEQKGKNNEAIFIHNEGDRCEWYGVNYPSIVELIITDQTGITKEFNNIEYMSESFTEDTHIDNYQDTLNTIQSFNDFLETDEVELLPYLKGDTLYTGGLSIPDTAPSTVKNIRRRERIWRTTIPRVDSETTQIDNYRMRDGYNRLRLTYNNEDDFQFILHPITTYYTLSNLE